MKKFKLCEVVVWEPKWWHKPHNKKYHKDHPLTYGEQVYYIGEIPNVPGHCIVAKYSGKLVSMIHPDELRKAREDEL